MAQRRLCLAAGKCSDQPPGRSDPVARLDVHSELPRAVRTAAGVEDDIGLMTATRTDQFLNTGKDRDLPGVLAAAGTINMDRLAQRDHL